MRIISLVLGLVLAALVAGCTPAAADLDGRDFLSVGVTDGGAQRPLVAGTQIRLSFTPGSLGATAGCNHIGGTYRIDGGVLIFEGAGMTEMGCDPPRHAQDEWLATVLSSRPKIELAGDTLVITAGATVIRLADRRVADPDRPLVGPTWVVVALIEGGADGAVSSIPAGVVASLHFLDDGTVEVHTGCNDGGGRWALDGAALRIDDIVLTKRACGNGEAQVEGAVTAVLRAGTIQPTIQASHLILAAGGQGLQLEAR